MRAATILLWVGLLAGSAWKEPAHAFLDAYRSYCAGRNTTADLNRLWALQQRTTRAEASYEELQDALENPDPRSEELAVAHLAAARQVDPRLAELVLECLKRQDDAVVRELSWMAMAEAGPQWVRHRGPDIARALEHERVPNVMTVVSQSILPLLEIHDMAIAAAALASNGDEVFRKVLFASVYVHFGGDGLNALADRLRGVGRAALAADAEKVRAESEQGEARGKHRH